LVDFRGIVFSPSLYLECCGKTAVFPNYLKSVRN
jgi:hypothetical protein